MQTLATLKKDLEFNRGLSSLIEVLKNLAVAQYRILEQRMKTFENLFAAIEEFIDLVNFSTVKHPLIQPKDTTLGVVAVTSDSGLLGGLNMQIVHQAFWELENVPGSLIVIGERGKIYAREGRFPFVSFSGIKDEERYAQALQLRDYVLGKFFEGQFSNLKVIYPHPVSFTVQRVEIVNFLPFAPLRKNTGESIADSITESSLGDIVEYLAYLWMGQKFYEIFGLSRLAEFAARYVHLEESLQKLKEMDGKLRLQYFRVRHELIDRNMRELFSARLMYAH
jgi:ATP synthase F1 gamma subunit